MVFSPEFALFGETIAAECHDVADQETREVLRLFSGKRDERSHSAKIKGSSRLCGGDKGEALATT